MKRLISFLITLVLTFSMTNAAYASNKGKLIVDSVSANCGDTVDVKVTIDNPGIVAMRFSINYDKDNLTLTKVSNGNVFDSSAAVFGKDYNSVPYYVLWEDSLSSANNRKSGVIVTFTFKVNQNAKSGKNKITIVLDKTSTFDANLNDVDFAVENGSVTILRDKGDVNNDNKINSADALLILSYVVGKTKLNSSQITNADMNSDGQINSSDALMVLQRSVGL